MNITSAPRTAGRCTPPTLRDRESIAVRIWPSDTLGPSGTLGHTVTALKLVIALKLARPAAWEAQSHSSGFDLCESVRSTNSSIAWIPVGVPPLSISEPASRRADAVRT